LRDLNLKTMLFVLSPAKSLDYETPLATEAHTPPLFVKDSTALIEVLGEYFVNSFVAYKRNELERFNAAVTDWEFREYAYHL
jgi:glutamine synthetase